MATLTYQGDGEHSWEAIWKDVEALRKNLHAAGFDGAIAVVPEAHPNGHGWHLHCAVGKYVPKQVLEASWRAVRPLCGWVDIRKIRAATTAGPAGARAHARKCASYLSEYVTKGHKNDRKAGVGGEATEGAIRLPARPFNGKRYSLTRGHRVEVVRFVSLGRNWALHDLEHVCGYRLYSAWQSPESWNGPPIEMAEG